MFLYQSEKDTHFQCPSCGQRGSVATRLLDDALRDNAHVQISCTACKTKFEPHAPAADSLAPHEPEPTEHSGEHPSDSSGDVASDAADPVETGEDINASDAPDLPDLHDVWRQHDADDEEANAGGKTGKDNATTHNFPAWMHKKPMAEEPDVHKTTAGDADDAQPNIADADDAAKRDDTIDDALLIDDLIDDEPDSGPDSEPNNETAPETEAREMGSDAPLEDDGALLQDEDAALIEALKREARQDPTAQDALAEAESPASETENEPDVQTGGLTEMAPEEAVSEAETETQEKDDFENDAVIGGDALKTFDDTLDPFALPEIDEPATEEGATEQKNEMCEDVDASDNQQDAPRRRFSPMAVLSRLMARLRGLFVRQKADPEEAVLKLPAPDPDGMRVFGDDDFIDDEAFEEARRLAAVESDMRGNEPLADDVKPDDSDAPDMEADDVDAGELEDGATETDDAEEGENTADRVPAFATPPADGQAEPVWEPFPDDERPDDEGPDDEGPNDLPVDGIIGDLSGGFSGDRSAEPKDGRIARMAPPLSQPLMETGEALFQPTAGAPKRLTTLSIANLALAFILIFLTALNSYVLLRDKPHLNPLVEAKPDLGARVSLQNASFEILSDPEGDSLIVTARFSNDGGKAGLIDDYVIYLQDGNKKTLTSWTVIGGGQTVQAGQSRQINSTLFAPPAGVAHISIEYPAGN